MAGREERENGIKEGGEGDLFYAKQKQRSKFSLSLTLFSPQKKRQATKKASIQLNEPLRRRRKKAGLDIRREEEGGKGCM